LRRSRHVRVSRWLRRPNVRHSGVHSVVSQWRLVLGTEHVHLRYRLERCQLLDAGLRPFVSQWRRVRCAKHVRVQRHPLDWRAVLHARVHTDMCEWGHLRVTWRMQLLFAVHGSALHAACLPIVVPQRCAVHGAWSVHLPAWLAGCGLRSAGVHSAVPQQWRVSRARSVWLSDRLRGRAMPEPRLSAGLRKWRRVRAGIHLRVRSRVDGIRLPHADLCARLRVRTSLRPAKHVRFCLQPPLPKRRRLRRDQPVQLHWQLARSVLHCRGLRRLCSRRVHCALCLFLHNGLGRRKLLRARLHRGLRQWWPVRCPRDLRVCDRLERAGVPGARVRPSVRERGSVRGAAVVRVYGRLSRQPLRDLCVFIAVHQRRPLRRARDVHLRRGLWRR
jgi:hypothetical protein